MVIPDDDLALIDAAAEPNRTAFMLSAAKELAVRRHRERLDEEIARCLAETASEDRALAAEFAGVVGDGLSRAAKSTGLTWGPESEAQQRNRGGGV
jgi:hypothetical protein